MKMLVRCISFFICSTVLAYGQEETARTDILKARCEYCHGPNGVSGNPIWPSLAGQNSNYLEERMQSFASGKGIVSIDSLQMKYVLGHLSTEDTNAIAAYYADLPPPSARYNLESLLGAGDAVSILRSIQLGRIIYHQGTDQVEACRSCHAANGQGDEELGMPRLAGQFRRYTLKQLAAYQSGARDDRGSGMSVISEALLQEEMDAVALYIATLE